MSAVAVRVPASATGAPLDVGRPFLRQNGLRHGLTKHRLDGPEFHRLFDIVRVAATVELSTLLLARAALLVVPRSSVISHHSAAALWGGAVPSDARTHVSVRRAQDRRRRPGLTTHLRPGPEFVIRYGVPVTSPCQTFCDMAAKVDLVELVVLGDSLVHQGLVTPRQLREAASAWAGSHRARLRRAADLVRRGVESPMETRVRLLLVFAGLPEPQVNIVVSVRGGTVRYRVDLSFPDLLLAIEYDGRQHAESTTQWAKDITRREDLDGEHWRLIVLRSTDVFVTPWRSAQRVAAAMAARGFEVRLSVPPQDFRVYFPGRAA